MYKKIMSMIMVCAMLVMLSGNYAEAAASDACVHTTWVKDGAVRVDLGNGGYHVERTVSFMVCFTCRKQMTPDEEVSRVTVSCNYRGNPYDDLGHNGNLHRYRLHCKCGSSYTVVLPCIVENGLHTLPF